MKKILIIGPISDFGGRELMSGFISSVLKAEYDVSICTTEFINYNSQVFSFDSVSKIFSLKGYIFKKSFVIRLLAFFSYLKNKKKNRIEYYANNYLAKKYFSYSKKIELAIKEVILSSDLILINAQISSNYTKFIIEESKKNNKKIIFRTTGKIELNQNYPYLSDVDLFIHHSEKNACRLKIENHNYKIIDQCAFNENELLQIPVVNREIKVFLTIARLEKEKNIDVVIKSFLKIKSKGDVLYVIGDGFELVNLMKMANNDESIVFTGFVSNDKLHKYFSIVDCVIISHYDFETGPLTGVEAMASGRIILSAKTGAMEERLGGIALSWFDNSVESLSEEMMKIKLFDKDKVENLSNAIRDRYTSYYFVEKIGLKYIEAIGELINVT